MGGKGLSEPKQAAWLLSAGQAVLRHGTEQAALCRLHRTHRVEGWFVHTESIGDAAFGSLLSQSTGFPIMKCKRVGLILNWWRWDLLCSKKQMTWPGPALSPRAETGLTGLSCRRSCRKRGFVTAKTWLPDCILGMEKQPGPSGVPLCCTRFGRTGKERENQC